MKKSFLISVFVLVLSIPVFSEKDITKSVQVALFKGNSGEEYYAEFTAMRRVFETQGIPFRIVEKSSDIFDSEITFISGPLLEKNVKSTDINNIYEYVEGGGTVFTSGEVSKRFYPLFGVREYIPSRSRYRLAFKGDDPVFRYIDSEEERTISLGNGEKNFYDEVIWSHGYMGDGESSVLGEFPDGTGGFIKNSYGRGTAYLFGLSFVESVMLPQIGDDYEAQRKYVNSFEPSSDAVMLILKAIYIHHNSRYIIKGTTPALQNPVLVLSHDVDAQTSFVDSLKYADLEEGYGVTSTFFENTKYFKDYLDIAYYDIEENRAAIRTLKKRGWDIGSHTVSHYKKLSKAPIGDFNVNYRTYDPVNRKTLRGEVAVSKELLDKDIPGQNTVSFRAGDLEYHNSLIKTLEEYGYLYDSTFSSNDVLTAFPYYAFRERVPGSPETDIIEIPVTLDDSLGFLVPGTVDKAVMIWKRVVDLNMDNYGITVLLIHPSDTRTRTHKLEAQNALMKYVSEKGGWMGNLTEFGEFWRNRSKLNYRLTEDKGEISLRFTTDNPDPRVGFSAGGFEKNTFRVTDSKNNPLLYKLKKHDGEFMIYNERGQKGR